jgi:hypothetical protein
MKKKPLLGNTRRPHQFGDNIIFEFTNKIGEKVVAEAFQERKLALLLERNKFCTSYTSQPLTYKYCDSSGRLRSYTPDFLARFIDRPDEIYECSLSSRLKAMPRLEDRLEAGYRLASETSRKFIYYDEHTLPDDTETANLLEFYVASSERAANDRVAQRAIEFLRQIDGNRVHFTEISRAILELEGFNQGTVNLALRHMIWRDELQIDWKKLFYLSTKFTGKKPAKTAYVWLEEE